MSEHLHLPWDRESLKTLLQKIILTSETTKVDLKKEFDLSDTQHQADLLKDISAFANTYSHFYHNHGFIIFGAAQGNLSYTTFPNTEDHLQATIDDLVKKFIGPFITSHLFIFDEESKQWGALVIPPTRSAPHIFINDTHKRYRGDIYVRNGTITEKAQPGDFARFFRQHLEEHTYDFQQQIDDLQRQLLDLRKQNEKQKITSIKKTSIKKNKENLLIDDQSKELQTKRITETINTIFAREEDIVTKGLLVEVNKIKTFLESNEIPWEINTVDKKSSEEMISKIESVSTEFWTAIVSIALKDDKGVYDDTLIKVISYSARLIEPPSGTTYTEWGKNIRYFSLFIALYLLTIICVSKKKDKLLKRIFKIHLQSKSHYEEPLSITYILFSIRRANEIFHPLFNGYPERRWCDPVSSFSKPLIDKILNFEDTFWDKEREYFVGEYVLCIAPLDILEKEINKAMIGHPSSGLYIYYSSSIPIITRFLKNEKEWLKKVFERPLDEILSDFDRTAKDLGRSSGCFIEGFTNGSLEIAFPEKRKTLPPHVQH